MLAWAVNFDILETMLRCKLLIIFLLGLFLSALGGCQSMSERKRDESLHATLALYAKVLRWQGIEEQGAMLANPSLAPRINDVKVTSYEVASPVVMRSENSATQTAVIEYLYQDSQIIKRIVDHQLWEYDSESQRWLRANAPPAMPR
jgi:hypothetical protein